jgi:hypothetical protein
LGRKPRGCSLLNGSYRQFHLFMRVRTITMPSSQLKRAEKAIEIILRGGEPVQSAEVGSALQELLDVVRSLERRMIVIEGDAHSMAARVFS